MREDKIKFIKKSTLFAIILVLILFIVNLGYLKFIEPKKIIERKDLIYREFLADLKGTNLEFVIFGDSHAESGLNPSYLNNSFNFALGGESYVETYFKLKKILEKDKVKISNVVLQIDLHTFSGASKKKERLFEQLYFYSGFVGLKEISALRDESVFSLFVRSRFPVLGQGKDFVKNILRPDEATAIQLGWTNNHVKLSFEDKNKLAQMAFQDHFSNQPLIVDSQILSYFLKTLELAKENSINVVLVKYPLSKEYDFEVENHSLAKDDYYDKILSEADKILTNYTLLDYYSLFFENSDYFFDVTHLTAPASEIFSKKFKEDAKASSVN